MAVALPQAGQEVESVGGVRFITLAEAKGVLHAFSSSLPPELRSGLGSWNEQQWLGYARKKDSDVRARLALGDLDTLANLLLFGTSYTKAAQISPDLLRTIHASPDGSVPINSAGRALLQRISDLAEGLARPGSNDRLRYFQGLVVARGYGFSSSDQIEKVKRFLADNLLRMLGENTAFAQALQQAQAHGEAGFAERSQVFTQRGISLDTSVFPSYAIERALKRLGERGLLQRKVTRIGIIGPGLDVVNKDQGLDVYPEQTLQPFLTADSLVKLGLVDAVALQIVTIDISDQLNRHLTNARRKAEASQPYIVQLPLRRGVEWDQDFIRYWKQAGDTTGRQVRTRQLGNTFLLRAVSFPPSEVKRVRAVDLDVSYQTEDLPEADKFDLILATNVFVYYDSVAQGLAAINIAHMLRSGGVFLTNDVFPDYPERPLRQVAVVDSYYSARSGDADRIVCYRRP